MSLLDSPRSWKPRKWIFQVHLYAGLSIGLVMTVVGLSGAALVYAPELETAPRWSSAPVTDRLPLDRLSRLVLAGYPGFRLQDIRLDPHGNATHLHVQRDLPPRGKPEEEKEKEEPKGAGEDLHLVVDPATGAVLKAADHHSGAWHWLRMLHHDLLAGRTGRVLNGVVAACLLVLCLTGIVVWWPGRKLWRKRLWIQSGSHWKRLNWDLHHAFGFWIAGMLAVLSFTGMQFAWPEPTKAAIRWITRSAEPPKKEHFRTARGPAAPGPMASLDLLALRAQQAVPDGRLMQIKLPRRDTEAVESRVKTCADGHQEGNNKVFLDRGSASILRIERFDRLPLGNRIIALLEPLHMGRMIEPGWTSVVVRLLWIAAGVAPGFLFVTGFLMWWNRTASKRLASAGLPRIDSLRGLSRAAALFLLLLLCWRLSGQTSSCAGRVLDATGAPIAGAKVTLRSLPERIARTDISGAFEFSRLAPGAYPVSIEAAGFETVDTQLREGERQDFTLSPAAVIETIVVNAGTFDQVRLEEPVASTGLSRADIATRNNRRLSDVIGRMPGVFFTGPPGGDKDVRLRGLDKEFSRTQVDAIVIPDGGEKRELQLNRIPSSVVDSVRIVRNPTSDYKSDGLAGRVDVQTRPIPEAAHLDGRIGYGARRNTLANDIAQGQLAGGYRFHRNFGAFASFDLLDDTLPIGRDKSVPSGTLEAESERQRQRSPNFFGDFGVYTERWGEMHFKPVWTWQCISGFAATGGSSSKPTI